MPTPLTALAGEALRVVRRAAIDYDTLDMPGHTLHRMDKKGNETWCGACTPGVHFS
jgi:hypothetical protein